MVPLAPPGAGAPIRIAGANGLAVVFGFVLYVAASLILGPGYGLPVLLALMLRELGLALGRRLTGDARPVFHLVPRIAARRRQLARMPAEMASAQPAREADPDMLLHPALRSRAAPHEASSDRLAGNLSAANGPATDGDEFLIAIMGPALSLGPAALALCLSALLRAQMPFLSDQLLLLATGLGIVNFTLLLPFRPFDGARCMRCAVASYWPALAPAMAVFMATAMATAALRSGSLLLMGGALLGAASLLLRPATGRVPMRPDQGLLALGAYVFTMAAHFTLAWMALSPV